LALGGALLAALGLVGHCGQRRLLYFPARESLADATQRAASSRLEPWRSATGELLGWRGAHPSGRCDARALVLHGNAGSAEARDYVRRALQAPEQSRAIEVYLMEYPGYGPRQGEPTEASLIAAANDALEELTRESEVPTLLIGESLGSAVAALATAAHPERVRGVALLTPLASVAAVARRHYPLLPTWLLRDRYRADLALTRMSVPVAFVVAGQDEITFADLGLALYTSYTGPKRLWVEANASHNGLDWSPRRTQWREVVAFLLGE